MMNEIQQPETSSVVLWLFGLLMAIGGYFVRRIHNDVDDLKKNTVSRADLNETLKQMREDRMRMHEQNREDLHYIRERVDSLVDRE